LDYNDYKPLTVRPNDQGRITVGTRIRSGFSRWFFEDRVMPVAQKELDEAKH